jgi:hypothetical protein
MDAKFFALLHIWKLYSLLIDRKKPRLSDVENRQVRCFCTVNSVIEGKQASRFTDAERLSIGPTTHRLDVTHRINTCSGTEFIRPKLAMRSSLKRLPPF